MNALEAIASGSNDVLLKYIKGCWYADDIPTWLPRWVSVECLQALQANANQVGGATLLFGAITLDGNSSNRRIKTESEAWELANKTGDGDTLRVLLNGGFVPNA